MAQKKAPRVQFELKDADLKVAYNTWLAAKAAKEAAETALEVAGTIIQDALVEAGATQATIAGTPVINIVDSRRVTFDAAILRKLAPVAAAKAEKVSPYSYLRKA